MDFNQDKDSLIQEEQKIADNLIKKMTEALDELDEEYQTVVIKINNAINSQNHDEYSSIVYSNKKMSSVQETRKSIYTAKDSLYQKRIVLKTKSNGKERIREIKIGLKDCTVGAKPLIFGWKNPICLHYMTDDSATEYCVSKKTVTGNYTYYHTLLFKQKTNFRFAKVTDTFNEYPIVYDEKVLRTLIGSEQNMIIQGCAGAGKSMIMFHRLSVLIYKAEQERYSRIFVITPSKTYIQMSGNMLYELEIQHIHMGTLKQYF